MTISFWLWLLANLALLTSATFIADTHWRLGVVLASWGASSALLVMKIPKIVRWHSYHGPAIVLGWAGSVFLVLPAVYFEIPAVWCWCGLAVLIAQIVLTSAARRVAKAVAA